MAYKLNKTSILIVEDMLPMLSLTKSLLHILGFRAIFSAKDGQEGYETYLKENPDIVITDWHMNHMDGLELIDKIRNAKDSPNPYVPIVLMTGYSSQSRVESARDNGMTEFLMKPYTAKDLYNKIVQLIEKPRPFIKADDFFGPDRRRRDETYAGPTRRTEDFEKEGSDDEITFRDKDKK